MNASPRHPWAASMLIVLAGCSSGGASGGTSGGAGAGSGGSAGHIAGAVAGMTGGTAGAAGSAAGAAAGTTVDAGVHDAALSERDAAPADPPGGPWTLTAPSGELSITVRLAGDARHTLEYQVALGAAVVVTWSPLGLTRKDQAFIDGFALSEATPAAVIDETYELPRGKQRQQHALGRERTLRLTSGTGRLDLLLRAYDDGVAFRYVFPEAKSGTFTVTGESTGFALPAGAVGYLAPQEETGQYTPAYEGFFAPDIAAGTQSPTRAGWAFPALFKLPSPGGATRWVLLTESGLDAGYAATHLAAQAPNRVYRIAFPDAAEGRGVDNSGPAEPSSALPWTLPWRVLIVGATPAAIVESALVTHLAAPSKVADASWVRPGRVSWSWWSDEPSPGDYTRLVPFVDLAARMGWEYSLVDAGWNDMKNGNWQQLVAYAKGRNVKLLLWYNSGGPHNDITAAPRDRLFDRDKRRAEFKTIADAGIAGVKIDFFGSDKQRIVAYYEDILADAAERKLVVNFHGATLPRGWDRTWPNLLSVEAVRGAEHLKYEQVAADRGPIHGTILPFTRNVVGPMDYTPVTLTRTKYPHKTTNAYELALGVVYESGLQHLADSVTSYDALPAFARDYLSRLPVAWDETRLVDGEPAKLVVLARRRDRTWYLGVLNGENQKKDIKVPLSFLSAGPYSAAAIADGSAADAIVAREGARASTDSETITLLPYGGFVARYSPP